MSRALRWTLGVLAAIVVLAAVGYTNRLTLLQYSLGWYTDIRFPRDENRPVPWRSGPENPAEPAGRRPPNIVVIVADDLGINDVSTYGGWLGARGAPTPNIDAIANEGARFDVGYAGSAVCTPSRAALLTGRYPWRFGAEFTPTPGAMARVVPVLHRHPSRVRPVVIDDAAAARAPAFDRLGLPPSEITLAELLHDRGYHTVHIGKWHLGSVPAMRPTAQGFDESLFMESGLYLPAGDPRGVESRQDFDPIDRFLWPNMRFAVSYNGGRWFEPSGYLTDYFTDEAVEVIRRNRHRPFFLYLAHWGVHTPLQASREDYDALASIPDHRERVYAAMVRSLDRGVGRVMRALRDEGLDEDTIVVFTSDNGAPNYIGLPDVNRPFRGWKLTLFEGGLRVPYLVRWPRAIAAGTVERRPASHVDLLPTLVAAAGGAPPADRPIDGIDLLARLAPDAPAAAPRALHWRTGPYRAIRDGRWKLVAAGRPARRWLFDLEADPTERNDLSAAMPDKVAELEAAMRAHHDPMPPPAWASFIEYPVSIDLTLDRPESPDDEHAYWVN